MTARSMPRRPNSERTGRRSGRARRGRRSTRHCRRGAARSESRRLAAAGEMDGAEPVRRARRHRRDQLVRRAGRRRHRTAATPLAGVHHPRRLRLDRRARHRCRTHPGRALDFRRPLSLPPQLRRQSASLRHRRHRRARPRAGLGGNVRPAGHDRPARGPRLPERFRQRRHQGCGRVAHEARVSRTLAERDRTTRHATARTARCTRSRCSTNRAGTCRPSI